MLIPFEVQILSAGLQLQRQGIDEWHGYQLAKVIKELEGARLLTAHGTLYKALGRLEGREEQGELLIKGRWEDPAALPPGEHRPLRKYYQVTGTGALVCRRALSEQAAPRPAPALGATSLAAVGLALRTLLGSLGSGRVPTAARR